MIHTADVLAVCGAELRRTRRLVRYWVFLLIAFLIPVGTFVSQALAVHRWGSTLAASFAMINPRFFISNYGMNFLLIYMLGVIFLGFDVRARDVKARVAEVLDARPIGNFEFLAGRWLGLFVASWAPLMVLMIVMQLSGLAIGLTIEPVSLLTTLTVEAIPALAFIIALVFFVTLLVRHRLVAAIVLLAGWGGIFACLSGWIRVELANLPLIDPVGWSVSPFPSDILSGVPDVYAWAHRGGVLVAGLGLLVLAAAVHPRRDDGSPPVRLGAGLAVFAAGAALVTVPWVHNHNQLESFEHYRQVHRENSVDSGIDLERVAGGVRIDPGRELALDLDLTLKNLSGEVRDEVLVTLNAGIAVESLQRVGGGAVPFEASDGLIRVALEPALAAGETITLHMTARGLPDPAFGHLDATRHTLELTVDAGVAFLFGWEPMIFESGYVALMPGGYWLPSVGTAVSSTGGTRAADPFLADLEIDAPEGWTLAGPGRAEERPGAEGGRTHVRFAPAIAIERVAIVGGRFEEFRAETEGTELALLMSPAHAEHIEPIADAGGEIVKRVGEKLAEARELGLPYPLDGLTMVEVPNVLKGYSGGWRQDTTLAQPGMVLVRESGFPTARWDVRFDEDFEFGDGTGGKPGAMVDFLERFFAGDIGGGRPSTCAARTFFDFTVGYEGDDGPALGFALESLTTWLLLEERSYFSARMFEGQEFQQLTSTLLPRYLRGGARSLGEALMTEISERQSSWNALEVAPLATYPVEEDPRKTVDAFVLKGGALARTLAADIDRKDLASLLATLRERYAGLRIGREEVVATAAELNLDVERWLSVWLDTLELPAFAVERAEVFRLDDAEDGTPRYQHVVRVRNDGEVPGAVFIEARLRDVESGTPPQSTDPFVIEAGAEVEIGAVYHKPAMRLDVWPYLSANRGPVSVEPLDVTSEALASREPWTGKREVEYGMPDTDAVVVDDLDEGFSVPKEEEQGWARVGVTGPVLEVALDQGLPPQTIGGAPSEWTRLSSGGAWGRYRHTTAAILTGDPERTATFAGELPASGEWHLEYHRPGGLEHRIFGYGRYEWGKISFSIESGGREHQATWDARESGEGWVRIDTFDMEKGPFSVTVAVAEEARRFLAADAIRWVPAGETAGGAAGGAEEESR